MKRDNDSLKLTSKIEKIIPKVKIGSDIFIFRTLYLITKEELFKDKSQKSITFYLKCLSKEKLFSHLPKPKESDIIIDEIKELIELTLSLCILTNSANYKISLFTSNFGNIENNTQLMKYKGNIIYAKLNEFQRKEKNEDVKSEYVTVFDKKFGRQSKKNSFIQKESQSIVHQNIFPKKKEIIFRNNSCDDLGKIKKLSYNQVMNLLPNVTKYKSSINQSNILSGNNITKRKKIFKNKNIFFNNKMLDKFKRKLNKEDTKQMTKTYSLLNSQMNNFKSKKDFSSTTNSLQVKECISNNIYDNLESNKISNEKFNLKIIRDNIYNKKIELKTRYLSPFGNNGFQGNGLMLGINCQNIDFWKINNMKKMVSHKKIDEKKIQKIKSFLFNKSKFPLNNNNFESNSNNNNLDRDILNEFKKKLLKESLNINEYIDDTYIEELIEEIQYSINLTSFDLNYCIKEYIFYCYLDNYTSEKFPGLINNLEDDIIPDKFYELLRCLENLFYELKHNTKYIYDFIKKKNSKKMKLGFEFFEIFIFSPNYFDIIQREIGKKFYYFWILTM